MGDLIPRTIHQLLGFSLLKINGSLGINPSSGGSWLCHVGDLCVPHSQERINCLEGSHEFFEAIGFKKVTLPVPDQGETAARQVGGGGGGMRDTKTAVTPLQRVRRSSTSWERRRGHSRRAWRSTSNSCWVQSLCGPLWIGSSGSSAPQPWPHILSSPQTSSASQLRR